MSIQRSPTRLQLEEAAQEVALPSAALEALAGAGYLPSAPNADGSVSFDPADLAAFVARNSADGRLGGPADLDTEELVDLLDERAEHMAIRLLKMYSTVFPQAGRWPASLQTKFVERTKNRFQGILATAALGHRFDPDFVEELRSIGASAARSGVRLPQILTMLRISRDMVVQNAVDLAGNGDRPGGPALSMVLTRILPAMDRISDSLAAGYWEAMFPGGAPPTPLRR